MHKRTEYNEKGEKRGDLLDGGRVDLGEELPHDVQVDCKLLSAEESKVEGDEQPEGGAMEDERQHGSVPAEEELQKAYGARGVGGIVRDGHGKKRS